MKIKPINKAGSHRTGTLIDTSVDEIISILGFAPNVQDDPDKVKHSWGFRAGKHECGIWDYKGSETIGQFSTYGSDNVFRKLFGDKYDK